MTHFNDSPQIEEANDNYTRVWEVLSISGAMIDHELLADVLEVNTGILLRGISVRIHRDPSGEPCISVEAPDTLAIDCSAEPVRSSFSVLDRSGRPQVAFAREVAEALARYIQPIMDAVRKA